MRRLASLVIIFCVADAKGADAPAMTVREVDARVFQNRKVITRGYLLLRSKYWSAPSISIEKDWYVWFDGARVKSFTVPGGKDPYQEPRDIAGKGFDEGDYVSYYGIQLPPDSVTTVTIKRAADINELEQLLVPNPTMMGLFPTTFASLGHYHFESFVGTSERAEPTLERSTWQGHDCWIVHQDKPKKTVKQHYWVVPDWGWSVVKLRGESVTDASTWDLVSEVARDPHSGCWFPKSWKYNYIDNGAPFMSEELTVLESKFNFDLPTDCFSIKSLKLPVGRLISDLTTGSYTIWDGREAVDKADFHPATAKPKGRTQWWLIGLSGAAVLYAVYLIVHLRKKKPPVQPVSSASRT